MDSNLWTKHYPSNVPKQIEIPNTTLNRLYDEAILQFPNRKAVSCYGHTLDYVTLNEKVDALAYYLQETLKIKKGDHIAIMLPNLLQFPIALFAILKVGAVFVNINPLYTSNEVRNIAKDARIKAAIVLNIFAHHIEKAMAELPHLKCAIVTEVADCHPFFKKHLINFIARNFKGMQSHYTSTKFHQLSRILSQTPNTLTPIKVLSTDLACIQYSSGTTGTPKGTLLTHGNLVANVHQVWAWIGKEIDLSAQIIIGALPLYHIFALTANLFTFFFKGSEQVLIPNPRDIPNLVKTLKKTPFSIFNCINTLYVALLKNTEFCQSTFPHFKHSLSGGMSTQQKVADAWRRTTGVEIKEAYGLSEMSPAVTINKFDDSPFNGSVGYPLPNTEVSIRNNNGQEEPVNTNGEIWVKGPQKSPGFWNLDKITKEHFTEDGWLKTGDIGFLDEEGRLVISGRSKNMLIVSGFNVFPKEIENVILKIKGIEDVAVIGVPSEKTGEKPVAFVMLEANKTLTKDDIIQACYQDLAHYKTPKDIIFVTELPKNNVGKVMKNELKAHYCSNKPSDKV